jgi:hypothetical protein
MPFLVGLITQKDYFWTNWVSIDVYTNFWKKSTKTSFILRDFLFFLQNSEKITRKSEQFSYTLRERFSGKTYFSLKVKACVSKEKIPFLQNVSKFGQENCSLIFSVKIVKIEN